ncbi:hypothetical protein [Pedobacter miscanthi]|uniref:hypothetical protein n=1 Tax=Pedobacter miscanthi TaxID=2259170 RepID=UPI002931D529|nr:hypothetical protein [Pedobacter miscanthi]
MKNLCTILFVLTFVACHSDKEKKNKPITGGTAKKAVERTKAAKMQLANITIAEFVGYNDDGDYFQLMARTKNETLSFINESNDDRGLLRGDLISIVWKTDTIYIAGDGDTPQLAEKIISVKKLQDGKVSRFRKTYNKILKYHWPQEENYTKSYLDKLYMVVEYYVAGSKNQLLELLIKNGEEIDYSIEPQTREGREYVLIGISGISAHHSNTIQWLYYDNGQDKLYEYDLPKDSLIEFNR